ncbi:MAG: hypothetical protein LC803_16635 [Acidobacteria bacterium]|nr:hypothetical protein [Acidobacteriota bacterium]
MADTKRQKIVDAVIVRMQTIRIENGYQTDVGVLVEDWPERFDDDQLPALGVCDLPDDITKENKSSLRVTHKLRVQVRFFVRGGTRPRELRKMMGDVVKAVGVDMTWGDLATDTEPASEGFIIPTEAMIVAGGAVEFIIEYLTDTFDPYQ